jgi:hypothetical protein
MRQHMSRSPANKKLVLISALVLALALMSIATSLALAANTWTVDAALGDDSGCVSPTFQCKTIEAAVGAAAAGDTINVLAGTYTLSSVVTINKANLTLSGAGAAITFIKVSGTGERLTLSASGITVQGFDIEKTDKPGVQNIIGLYANNITVKNNTIHGQFVLGEGDVSRAMVGAGGLTSLNIEGNTIYGLRQPAYFSGPTTGTVQNNYVYRTKGWVLEGGSLAFTGNTWGTGAQANAYDIAILATVGAGPYPDIVAMSNANNGAVIEDQRVSPAVLSVVNVDDDPSGCTFDCGAGGRNWYQTIAPAITRVVAGGTIHIAAGTYVENVNINKRVALIGAGSGTSGGTIISATGGYDGVVQLSTSGLSAVQPILLKDLRIQPIGKAGISVGMFASSGPIGANVSFVELNNVKVIGTNLNPCSEQERGLYVDLTSSLTNLKISNSAFDNLTYGWYLQKHVSTDTSTVQYVDVQNTTFKHNALKGLYAEKLEDATFTNVTVDQNGYYDASLLTGCLYFAPWMSGFDINLKAGTYQNLAFVDSIFTNNGLGGAKEGVGITVKARDDGATYGAFPASVSNVSITGGAVSGNERGIRFGEPGMNNATPTGVTVSNVCIVRNIKKYSGSDGSAYGGLIDQRVGTAPIIVAENNWWGDASGPYNATSNPGGTGNAVVGNVDFSSWTTSGCPTKLDASTTDSLICTGQTTDVYINLTKAVDVYGYEFEVSYGSTYASATGAFVDSFFDTQPPASIPSAGPPFWNAACSGGTCRFSVVHVAPQQPVSGSGPLAKITLTGVAPGAFSMTFSSPKLTDINSIALPHTLGAPLPITVCGLATVSGQVTMQGRPGNIGTPGTVTLTEQTPTNFTPPGVAPVAFSAPDGTFIFTNVPYMLGGSSYKIAAAHDLYLTNAKLVTVSGNLTNQNTWLWGGDANNSGKVEINDLSCIGASFHGAPPGTCSITPGDGKSADINADGIINVQDLAVTGGNFDKASPQPW